MALNTMMAKCYTLSTAMCNVLPLQNLTITVAKAVGIPDEHLSTFKVTCWEDNTAAETLANMDPGHATPRSKLHDVKVKHLSKDIQVKRINTKE